MDLQEARRVAQQCQNFFRAFERIGDVLAATASIEALAKSLEEKRDALQGQIAELEGVLADQVSKNKEHLAELSKKKKAADDAHRQALREMGRERSEAKKSYEEMTARLVSEREEKVSALDAAISGLSQQRKEAEAALARIEAEIERVKQSVGAVG